VNVLPIGTPILFTIGGKRPLTNLAAGGGPEPAAAVVVQVQDLAGNPVGAPTDCAYVGGTAAEYQGISPALALAKGIDYDVVATATKAAAVIWTARQRLRADYLTGI
jgi:hypothetical protein